MSAPFRAGVGEILSADMAVPDHERIVAFYARVLGTGPEPLWRDDLLNNVGIPIVGLGARTEAHRVLPLQWMPHIQVADVAESARRAVARNGKELLHERNAEGGSLWAVLLDPAGAAFGIIPEVPGDALPPDASVQGEADAAVPPMGRIAWVDLTVPDAEAVRDFYMEVVGWRSQPVSMHDEGVEYADHAMVGAGGEAVAGVCHARGANAGLSPVWLLYLPVGDLDESLRRVEAGGGRIVHRSRNTRGALSYAVVEDPLGAAFALVPG